MTTLKQTNKTITNPSQNAPQAPISPFKQSTRATPPSTYKTVNLAPTDDDVVCMGAFDLSNVASDLLGASEALADIGHVLDLIARGECPDFTSRGIARLAQHTAETWASATNTTLAYLNEGLKQTRMGEVK